MLIGEDKKQKRRNDVIEQVKQILPLLGGISAIGIGFVWIVGKLWRAGYTRALNIPANLIPISTWESEYYAIPIFMTGLFLMIVMIFVPVTLFNNENLIRNLANLIPWRLYLVSTFFLCIFLTTLPYVFYRFKLYSIPESFQASQFIFQAILLWILLIGLGFTNIFCSRIWDRLSIFRRESLKRFLSILIISSTIILYICIILLLSFQTGTNNAKRQILTEPVRLRLLIDSPIFPDLVHKSIPIGENNALYIYEDIYLLAQDTERLYFFNSLDSNGTPKHIYIVNNESLESAEYFISTIGDQMLMPSPTSTVKPKPTSTVTLTTSISSKVTQTPIETGP